jgi:para-aminobenzoate synthetase/4-amino-4-deoxychorismate lyase
MSLLSHLLSRAIEEDNCVLLWGDGWGNQPRLFLKPTNVIVCNSGREIGKFLRELNREIARGYYACGYIAYEAGYFLEPALEKYYSGNACGSARSDIPLAWFGIYKRPESESAVSAGPVTRPVILTPNEVKGKNLTPPKTPPPVAHSLRPSVTREQYNRAIKHVKHYISRGETYQVNYTFNFHGRFQGTPEALFQKLVTTQPVPYAALIKFGQHAILSLSPELFFAIDGNHITVKPMKGTIARGVTPRKDCHNHRTLSNSLKDRAENLMIVDLLRNDIGRICKAGTVQVRKLFEIEKYRTVYQMTSTINGELKSGTSSSKIIAKIFPSGSVTGAPKIRTMQIISELEKEPRSVYTGTVGFIGPGPNRTGIFNVAIRTAILNSASCTVQAGVGGGIVWDSTPEKEYAECEVKAKFLTSSVRDFHLIETLACHPRSGYFLLDRHLRRLEDSAHFFRFKYDRAVAIRKLKHVSARINSGNSYRVRLLLSADGTVSISTQQLKKDRSRKRVAISKKRTDSHNIFLYHKTTNRKLYDHELKACRRLGYYDVLFSNERGEVTEGAISNILMRIGEHYYTPPVKCGLLNGVYRQYLLEKQPLRYRVKEKVVTLSDLARADEVLLVNSVRGVTRCAIQ